LWYCIIPYKEKDGYLNSLFIKNEKNFEICSNLRAIKENFLYNDINKNTKHKKQRR